MPEASAAAEPIEIELRRARRFLQKIKNHPFLALVVEEDGRLRLYYSRSMGVDELQRIIDTLEAHKATTRETDAG